MRSNPFRKSGGSAESFSDVGRPNGVDAASWKNRLLIDGRNGMNRGKASRWE